MKKTVVDITKSHSETLRIKFTEFKGFDLIDFRVYAKDDQDKPIPTRKGVTLRVALLPAIVEGAMKALQEAREAGLLEDDQEVIA